MDHTNNVRFMLSWWKSYSLEGLELNDAVSPDDDHADVAGFAVFLLFRIVEHLSRGVIVHSTLTYEIQELVVADELALDFAVPVHLHGQRLVHVLLQVGASHRRHDLLDVK